MAETTVPKLLDAKDPDSVKLWADKVYIALQDLLGVTPSSSTAGAAVGINSIQRGTVTISGSGTTGTATITSVDTAKTELRMLGFTSTTDTVVGSPIIELTNATTITATRGSVGTVTTVISWELTEYE